MPSLPSLPPAVVSPKPPPWRGRPLDLLRYSGARKQEVELRRITGALALPHGPGPLRPLLVAVSWIHLGKGTVFGLGQMLIALRDETGA